MQWVPSPLPTLLGNALVACRRGGLAARQRRALVNHNRPLWVLHQLAHAEARRHAPRCRRPGLVLPSRQPLLRRRLLWCRFVNLHGLLLLLLCVRVSFFNLLCRLLPCSRRRRPRHQRKPAAAAATCGAGPLPAGPAGGAPAAAVGAVAGKAQSQRRVQLVLFSRGAGRAAVLLVRHVNGQDVGHLRDGLGFRRWSMWG